MKIFKTKLFLILMMLFICTNNCSHALVQSPVINQIQTTATKEEEFHQSCFQQVISFINGFIKFINGEETSPSIKSDNVKNVSNTIKTYQAIETKNNPSYSDSAEKDKTDFGIGLLDLLAGILKFFGL